ALPDIERRRVESLARQAWDSRPKRSSASFAHPGRIRRFDVDAFSLRPLADVRLRHFGDFRFGPVRKAQFTLEPQRHRPRDKVRTMSCAGLKSELKDVGAAAVQRNRPLPEILEEALWPQRLAGDYPVCRAVEDERLTAQGVQVVQHGAAVAEKQERL